jgi:hypothetical protein
MTPGWIYSLSDPLDETFGQDKQVHLFAAGCLWAVLAAHLGPRAAFLGVVIAGLGVELLECWRYQRWAAKGFPVPWPPMTDRISLKDLAADLLGAVGMWLLLRGHP